MGQRNLSDKIKVNYIDNYCNPSTKLTLEFAYWFTHTLTTRYLNWCKENLILAASTTTESDSDLDIPMDTIILSQVETHTKANAKVNKRDSQQEEEPIAKRLRSRWTNNNKRTGKQ